MPATSESREGQRPDFDVDDAIVLLLGYGGDDPASWVIRGITRLEKLVFLLEQETEAASHFTEKPEFEAYNFGPFSKKVYQAIDVLESAGLITDSAKPSRSRDDTWEEQSVIGADSSIPDYSTRDIRLTELGKEYFDALASELPKEVTGAAVALRSKFDSWPLRALIRYVYERHQAFTTNSLIRDEVLGTQS